MALNNISAARMHSRVVKYSGQNINVTPHNKELRTELTQNDTYTFVNSINMGYEGFSKAWRQPKMHPIVGNRGEYMFLALLFPIILMLKASREKNETGIRNALGNVNNKYAHLKTTRPSEF